MSEKTVELSVPTDANGRRIIAPTLHHYGTMTANIDAMVEWYGKVLGFVVTGSSTSPIPSAYVSNDLAHHRGGFFTAPGLATDLPKPRKGVGHVAFEYESLDDLLESWERLKDDGIEPLVMTCHGTHYAFYYRDPDDNTVELLADAWGSWERSYDYVGTPEYAENPMGPRVDPALLLEARRHGQSIDEIRERTMRYEFQPDEFLGPEVLM